MKIRILLCIAALAVAVNFIAEPSLASQLEVTNRIEHIESLYQQGEIDFDHYILFLIQAVKAPQLLPDEIKACPKVSDPLFCATPIMRLVQFSKYKLSPGIRSQVEALSRRPSAEEYVQSERYPFRVHYNKDRESYAKALVPMLEHCWDVEVFDYGFYPPHPDLGAGGSDDLDVYLVVGDFGGYVAPERSYPYTERTDYTCYMAINPQIGLGWVPSVIAHEFNHTCQFAMDAIAADCFFENTATFIQDEVYPDIPYHYGFLSYFQGMPYLSIDYFNYGQPYQYGAFMFLEWISEYYDGGSAVIIRRLWEEGIQNNWTNEPDYQDVFDSIGSQYGGTNFADALELFTTARYFTAENDDGRFSEAYKWGGHARLRLAGRFSDEDYPVYYFQPNNFPAEYGSNTYEITASGVEPLTITFRGAQLNLWRVNLVAFFNDGRPIQEIPMSINYGWGQYTFYDLDQYSKIVMSVLNMGDGIHDPDNKDWGASQYSLDLVRATSTENTPTPTPKPTPSDWREVAPQIMLGGYMETDFRAAEGGYIRLIVYVIDPQGRDDISSVELYSGAHYIERMRDDGMNQDFDFYDGIFSSLYTFEPGVTIPAMHLLEVKSWDLSANQSNTWPYLHVRVD